MFKKLTEIPQVQLSVCNFTHITFFSITALSDAPNWTTILDKKKQSHYCQLLLFVVPGSSSDLRLLLHLPCEAHEWGFRWEQNWTKYSGKRRACKIVFLLKLVHLLLLGAVIVSLWMCFFIPLLSSFFGGGADCLAHRDEDYLSCSKNVLLKSEEQKPAAMQQGKGFSSARSR